MAKPNYKKAATVTKPKPKNIDVSYKQGLFIQSTADMVLYGGAAGGGKSYGQLIDALYCADIYPGIRQLLLRESFPELKRSLIVKSFELFPSDRMQYNAADYIWYHSNGSIIEFGYLDSDESVTIYKSAEYDIIRIDEGTEFSQYRLEYMQSRIRGANNYPKQMKISTNPDGPGHKYLKKTFKIGVNKPCIPFSVLIGEDIYGVKRYETRCYIPSLVYENEFLMKADPNYINKLLKLPEKEQKSLLDGSWDINDDSAFPEFEYDIHVCKPFNIPSHWKKWRSVDNGYDDPFAWYWYTVDEQGTVYIYREFTRDKGDKSTMIKYSTQAEKVVEKSKYIEIVNGREVEKVEKFSFTVAGHDAFASHVRDSQGKTLVDYYNDGGVFGITMAVTDRKLRKAVYHEYLSPYMDENIGKMTAKLQIFDTCKTIIEKIPEMLKDPNDPEKVLDIDDHNYDSVGYGLIAHHANRTRALTAEKNDLEKYHDKLWKNAKRKDKRRR